MRKRLIYVRAKFQICHIIYKISSSLILCESNTLNRLNKIQVTLEVNRVNQRPEVKIKRLVSYWRINITIRPHYLFIHILWLNFWFTSCKTYLISMIVQFDYFTVLLFFFYIFVMLFDWDIVTRYLLTI